MKKQSIPILLIVFMMMVTPIVSACGHCSGMDLSNRFLENQSFSMPLMDINSVIDSDGIEEQQSNQGAMDCHCIFHACGGCVVIMFSVPIINVSSSLFYSGFESTSPPSNIPPSLLRPPRVKL